MVKPVFLKEPCDESVVQATMTEALPPLFDYLETQVAGAEFLQNKTISMSDIALVCPLISLYLAQESIDASRWPKLAAYYDFVTKQPVVAARIAQELAMLGR
ncbi:MAG: glutathione S-transferase family protein [Cellvibrionaceae bacterium]